MKRIFIVYSRTQKDGKKYAYADSIRTGENIIAILKNHGADICHLCGSRMEAEQIALEWNESYKNNGEFWSIL